MDAVKVLTYMYNRIDYKLLLCWNRKRLAIAIMIEPGQPANSCSLECSETLHC